MIGLYLLFWILLAIVAIANGILRQSTYGKYVPELVAHQVSTATGIALTGLVVWMLSQRWPIENATNAWIIGFCWLAMTVAFEIGFGHYLAGHSWTKLLADYNIVAGRIWSLFLVWITVMPYVFFRLGGSGA